MEWLNYHHLRYFWVVAKAGGLARAAEQLRISQPSLSGQIRELESTLGQRLFKREGRKNILTETGLMVLRYAEEIFSLGGELLNAVNERPGTSALRVHVGLTDSFPKLAANALLKPVFALGRDVHVVCREGKAEDLLAQLASHRLDVVLADEALSSGANIRVFDHPLGDSACLLAATSALARKLKTGFPHSLDGAPALLPSDNTPLRRAAEAWFRSLGIRPRVLAEFEDPALMKVMAADGRGFIILPDVDATTGLNRYRLTVFGRAPACRIGFHVFTADRRIDHPAVSAITSNKDWLKRGG